ncbi:hypothetical protein K1T71_003393 [Dendrolimus kikuchii]|uniref:Uncharacterized protein n=1 Tax=Dendrolimus kikuchii TaxID=765133 RepID=A0ACC1DBJ3_9NEOP|nr:hypothetical protein K1T71_003393 [Dendrolimus kikuchii]
MYSLLRTIDGKSYKAYVKEKEEAKQIYQEAVSQGISAAHVSAKARDSNHFTVAVNVESLSSVTFNLTYEELLTLQDGVYTHGINMFPGSLVPNYTITVRIVETEKITVLRVPEVRTGNEIDATETDAQNSKAVIIRGHDDREATITFKPDLDEQTRLMHVYAVKTNVSESNTNHLSLDGDNKAEGVLGQFVVQYDVERNNDGNVLVNDGYFVHFFAPKNLPVLNKYVIFVLDTSGSMSGRKIEQLKEAMFKILSDLNPGDYFSIVEFASSVTVHDLKEADQEPPKRHYYYYDDYSKAPTLVDPSQATPDNIAKAKEIIRRFEAVGGTNIDGALDCAVRLNNKRFRKSQPEEVSTNTTEAVPTAATDELTTESTSTTTVAATPSSLDSEKVKVLEPIIIFLTDGDATVGETNPQRITAHLAEKNSGPNKAIVFVLEFGEDADYKLLRKIALRHQGFSRRIYEGADAALQLTNFYRQVSSPLMANVKFSYPADQVKIGTVTKDEYRTFFAGSEVVVAGQLADAVTELTPTLSGFCGVDNDGTARKKYEKKTKVPVPLKKQGYLPLERLWAYLTIKQLLDQKDADDVDIAVDKEHTPEKKALNLALKYEFVTPLTSLVVVKPNTTSAVNAESVDNKKSSYDSYMTGGVPLSSQLFSGPAYPSSFAGGGFAPLSAPISLSQTPMSLSFQAEAFEESETLVDDYDVKDFYPTTTPPPVRGIYHLEKFPWADSILDLSQDALVLQLNETVTLKLTRDTNVPKSSSGDADCTNAVQGGAGLCVYLTRCESAQNITEDDYKSNYCLVDQTYAGVCCPKKDIDL